MLPDTAASGKGPTPPVFLFILTFPSPTPTPRYTVARVAVIDLTALPTFPSPMPMPLYAVAHTIAHTTVLANAADVSKASHASRLHQRLHTPLPESRRLCHQFLLLLPTLPSPMPTPPHAATHAAGFC